MIKKLYILVYTYFKVDTVQMVSGTIRPNPKLPIQWNEDPRMGHSGSSGRVILEHMAQDCVQAILEYLQKRRLHNFSGQSVPVLSLLHSKEFLPHIRGSFLSIRFCPLPLVLLSGSTEKRLDPSPGQPPFRYYRL